MLLGAYKETQTVVLAARDIADSVRAASPEYAEKKGKVSQKPVRYAPTPEQLHDLAIERKEAVALRIPKLSGNALRHCALRSPAADCLLSALGLGPVVDPVPLGVERFLYGGGSMAAKAKTPGNADVLETKARKAYPSVDALGGTADSFLFGSSKVSVCSWVICRESNPATQAIAGIESQVSLLELLDLETRTHQGIGGNGKEDGQMIYSYEVLATGTPILVEVSFRPWTSRLTVAAMAQALLAWEGRHCPFGGHRRDGHGYFSLEWITPGEAEIGDLSREYVDYLTENKTALAAGLRDATLTSGSVLCAAK